MKKIVWILSALICAMGVAYAGSSKTTTAQKEPVIEDQQDQTDTYAIPLDNSEAEEQQEQEELQEIEQQKQLKKPVSEAETIQEEVSQVVEAVEEPTVAAE